MNKILITIMLALALPLTSAHGHGVGYEISKQKALSVRFTYSSGEPMSYAKVKIFSPQSSANIEFQNGRTDKQGFFAFVPNSKGYWQIICSDNLGHKAKAEIEIKDEIDNFEAKAKTKKPTPTLLKIFFALSILINIAFTTKALINNKKLSTTCSKKTAI